MWVTFHYVKWLGNTGQMRDYFLKNRETKSQKPCSYLGKVDSQGTASIKVLRYKYTWRGGIQYVKGEA